MSVPLWQRLTSLGGRRRRRASGLVTVRFEQAVYGSFAFRHEGYALLAQSPGCRPEWIQAFRSACQKLGERPAGVADAPGLFTLRPADAGGVWAVVGMSPQGCDDRGRPGALAFHALFLARREFGRIDHDPFAMTGALRTDWSPDVTTLPAGLWSVVPGRDAAGPPDARVEAIGAALTAGRRVLLPSPTPIDATARAVWSTLPSRVRQRATVATWAFANTLQFDLVAVPRLAGITLDPSYLDPAAFDSEPADAAPPVEADAAGPVDVATEAAPVPLAPPAPVGSTWADWLSPRRLLVVGLLASFGAAAVAVALRGVADDDLPPPATPPSPIAADTPPAPPVRLATADAPPDPSAFRETAAEAGPLERRHVAEVLVDLADRCGVDLASTDPRDPAALIAALSGRLRYDGPSLSEADRNALAGRAETDREAALALRWDALVGRFRGDRPLSESQLRAGPLRWQLAMFARSFRLSDALRPPAEGPRRSPSEEAQALAEAFAIDVPLRPGPLVERHPALAGYLAFLARLPRR